MKPSVPMFALLLLALGILPARGDSPATVLDDWHQAGTAADFIAQMTTDAVLLGVGDVGTLEGPALRRHVDERFATGGTWGYRIVERDIRYAADGNTAWFTESLEDSDGGHRWGSGVLVKTGSGWKIAQYASAPLTGSATVTAPAPTVVQQGDEAQPPSEASAPTAAPATEPAAKKQCRKMRHKTNRVSSC